MYKKSKQFLEFNYLFMAIYSLLLSTTNKQMTDMVTTNKQVTGMVTTNKQMTDMVTTNKQMTDMVTTNKQVTGMVMIVVDFNQWLLWKCWNFIKVN